MVERKNGNLRESRAGHPIYLGGGVGGPNNPGRAAGVIGRGDMGAGIAVGGIIAGFGRHCAHAGKLGFGASIAIGDCAGAGVGVGAGRAFGALSRRVGLCTTRHAGRAWTGWPSSIGGGVVAMGGGAGGSWGVGAQLGEYSPPAPCFDLTAISSAISNWSCRRSSLSLPTSARRMRTSPASALLKSFKYFGGAPLYEFGLLVDDMG